MIQPLFDGMLAILLAKFAINDLPHAAGLSPCGRKAMYHTTLLKNWEKIRQEGLLPQPLTEEVVEASGLRSGIYLESDLEEAHGWASMLAGWELPEEDVEVTVEFAILRVEVPEGAILVVDPDVIDIGTEGSPTAFIMPGHIPPEHIELVSVTEVEVG